MAYQSTILARFEGAQRTLKSCSEKCFDYLLSLVARNGCQDNFTRLGLDADRQVIRGVLDCVAYQRVHSLISVHSLNLLISSVFIIEFTKHKDL